MAQTSQFSEKEENDRTYRECENEMKTKAKANENENERGKKSTRQY